MAVLVTGGVGYIGSHTVLELLNVDQEVVVVDNLSNSNEESLRRVQQITGKKSHFYTINLVNKTELILVFEKHNIDSVIHFAGFKAVGESVAKPLMYYQNNIDSTLVLCETMCEFGVKNLVFSSSATVYGKPATVPVTEGFSAFSNKSLRQNQAVHRIHSQGFTRCRSYLEHYITSLF